MQDDAEIFQELAPLLRVRPELKDICKFGAQWASENPPQASGWAAFHIVTLGRCLLDAGDQIGIPLEARYVAILPHGGPPQVFRYLMIIGEQKLPGHFAPTHWRMGRTGARRLRSGARQPR